MDNLAKLAELRALVAAHRDVFGGRTEPQFSLDIDDAEFLLRWASVGLAYDELQRANDRDGVLNSERLAYDALAHARGSKHSRISSELTMPDITEAELIKELEDKGFVGVASWMNMSPGHVREFLELAHHLSCAAMGLGYSPLPRMYRRKGNDRG